MEYKDLIRFVPAGLVQDDGEQEKKKSTNCSLTGEEAKSFYENLVCGESQYPVANTTKGNNTERHDETSRITISSDSNHNAVSSSEQNFIPVNVKQEPIDQEQFTSFRKKPDSDKVIDKRINQKLLQFAQNGDLHELKCLFKKEENIDIDYQDRFGWTGLMCAAVSNHHDVIRFLLSKDANKYILNNNGQTVLELCEEVGAIDAKIVINSYCKIKSERTYSKKKFHHFFCAVCKREFKEITVTEHERSMVHIFNQKLIPKSDKYLISENNRGFQLMKKSGWDGETGLGPSGQGSKYPVKTCLKRDRSCLGTEVKQKAKVTHFGPNDSEAVKNVHNPTLRKMSVRTIGRLEREKQEKRNKQWERNLRTYMNIDM